MSLMISIRREAGVAIVQVRGAMVTGPMLGALDRRVRRELDAKNCAGLVLSLAGVSQMDSAGIGWLVSAHTLAARSGLRLALVEMHPRLREMLTITRVDKFFVFHDDERSAVAGF